MAIMEKSEITLEVDGKIVDQSFHDSNDAWEKAMNYIIRGARKAVIKETVTMERLHKDIIFEQQAILKGKKFLGSLERTTGKLQFAKLGEKTPNFLWHSMAELEKPDIQGLRSCWIIRFDQANRPPHFFEVWIDAYTGEVIGGMACC